MGTNYVSESLFVALFTHYLVAYSVDISECLIRDKLAEERKNILAQTYRLSWMSHWFYPKPHMSNKQYKCSSFPQIDFTWWKFS